MNQFPTRTSHAHSLTLTSVGFEPPFLSRSRMRLASRMALGSKDGKINFFFSGDDNDKDVISGSDSVVCNQREQSFSQIQIQDDPSGCSLGFVDIITRVAFLLIICFYHLRGPIKSLGYTVVLSLNNTVDHRQGDTTRWFKSTVDFKTKVPI